MEQQWIVDVLMPKVLSDAFPEGTRLVSHEIGAKKGGNAGDGGFASNTFQIKFTVATPGGQETTDYVIAKIFPQDPALRAMHNSELQFHNEILWYKEVVPAYEALAARFGLPVAHLWPKFYASVDGALAAIVMQDLSREGFGLAQPPSSLSLQHAQIAMRKIGLLHALGYALQSHDKPQHQKLLKTLKDTRFGPEADGLQVDFLTATAERGIGPLRSRPECKELVAALDKAFGDPLEMQRRVLTANNESTDVLCHGDFLRNNLLYKQNKDDKALDARLIDFATARVASPGSDLALFIYISVDPKVLEADGLTNLLKTYHSALTDALGTMGKVKDPWGGNFQKLEINFARSAPMAYSICAFFLPLMMAPSGDFQMEDMMDMSPEEQQKQNMTLGGPEATQRLVDMLIDFQKRGFHKLW